MAGLCPTLDTVSGPDPHLDLPLHILDPCGEAAGPAFCVAVRRSWLAFP